jgi:predicted Zn-dependent peptidase
MDLFRRRLFGSHPYGWNPLGTKESVERITREDLVRWHRAFFVTQNLSFAAVGDIDEEAFARKLEACLAGVPAGPRPETPSFEVPRLTEPAVDRVERDKEQAVVILGLTAPSLHAPERFAHAVLNSVLSGMDGRLFSELRERQHLCYYTGSAYTPLDDAGMFAAYIGTSPSLVEAATDGLRHELERIKREPPTDEEMTRAINGITGSHLIGLQRSGSQASAFARYTALGLGHEAVLAYADRIRAIRVGDVVAAAERTLDLSRAATAILTAPAELASGPAPRT